MVESRCLDTISQMPYISKTHKQSGIETYWNPPKGTTAKSKANDYKKGNKKTS